MPIYIILAVIFFHISLFVLEAGEMYLKFLLLFSIRLFGLVSIPAFTPNGISVSVLPQG